jgi:rhamnogalacturonan endolyase
MSRFHVCLLVSSVLAAPARGADPAVTLAEDAAAYTLANGVVTARVSKRSGDLVSLKYKGLELLAGGSGHAYGYWSHSAAAPQTVRSVTIDPTANGGERAEVSVKGISNGRPLGSGPGGSTVCDVEIRYALGRGDSALYTYTVFTHRPEYPATSVGEARFAAKLNPAVFDHLTVDARRRKVMPTPDDWDRGTELEMKEVRRLNTGRYAGQVEHKYDYSAVHFDTPAYGWSGTAHRVGLWFINPSIEYLSGGATKVELTGHLDVNDGGAPTLLNYWRGSHYGSTSCAIVAGEAWTKVVGPFLIYCNAGLDPDAMWKDALARAAAESAAWPYPWVAGVDYPTKDQRGVVRGELVLADPQAPADRMGNLLVGLAAPDYAAPAGRRFGPRTIDWQLDAKFYQFWARGDAAGRFAIPNVRPGRYTLHAIADAVLGEFAKADVTVAAGSTIDLGRLAWTPVRHGRQVWEIGVPDRTAGEFRHGDHYWQFGLFKQYATEFPDDVTYVVGQSDYRRDWNFCQPPRADGRGTTWSVAFDLADAPRGTATLRLAIAGNSTRGIQVTVNDRPAGSTGPMPDTAVLRRDGIRGYWFERSVAFDAALLKAGRNVLKLSIPPAGVMNGVLYDYLRLELDESAPPPRGG